MKKTILAIICTMIAGQAGALEFNCVFRDGGPMVRTRIQRIKLKSVGSSVNYYEQDEYLDDSGARPFILMGKMQFSRDSGGSMNFIQRTKDFTTLINLPPIAKGASGAGQITLGGATTYIKKIVCTRTE